MAEATDLLDRGMADDYNCEPEHSATGAGSCCQEQTYPHPQRQRPQLHH